jgi:tellurite resistance protein
VVEVGRVFKALFGGLDAGRSDRALFLDAALMVAAASGSVSFAEREALAAALAEGGPLGGLSWAEVERRLDEVELEAPLFADARAAWQVSGSERAEEALAFAAAVASADGPLDDDERALLGLLADEQGLGAALPRLLAAVSPPAARAERTPFNDPAGPRELGFFDALAEARDPQELRRLVFKLHAVRWALNERLPGAQLTGVGEWLPVGAQRMRADAIAELDGHRWLMRCLSRGEALHDGEHELIRRLDSTIDRSVDLLLIHVGPLTPLDAALFASVDASWVRLELLEP